MTMIRVPRWVWITLAALALLAAALVGATAWVWHSESAFRWALARVPGLEAADVQGRPDRRRFGHRPPRVAARQACAWRSTACRGATRAGDGGRMRAPGSGSRSMPRRCARCASRPRPPRRPKEPARAPDALRLPFTLSAPGVAVGTLRLNEQPPLTGLRADVEIGAEQGAAHRIDRFTVTREGIVAQADLRVGSAAPLPVDGSFSVAAAPGASPSWQARGRLGGTLERLHVVADAQEASGAKADVDAALAPFAAWPLVALAANVSGIDLAAFSPALPSTRLSGRATMEGGTSASAAVLAIDAANDAPGPWDTRRLPVRTIEARLRGLPGQPDGVTFEHVRAVLAGPADAGTLEASGRWQGDTLSIDAALSGVQPRALDAARPGHGARRPGEAFDARPAGPGRRARAAASAPAPLAGEATLALTGRLAAPRATPVSVTGQAQFERAADGTLRLVLRPARSPRRRGPCHRLARRHPRSRRLVAHRHARRAGALRPRRVVAGVRPRARGSAPERPLAGDPRPAPTLALTALRGDARITMTTAAWPACRCAARPRWRRASSRCRSTASFAPAMPASCLNGRSTRQHPPRNGASTCRRRRWPPSRRCSRWRPPASADWLPQRGALDVAATMDGRWPAVAVEGTLAARGLRGRPRAPTASMRDGRCPPRTPTRRCCSRSTPPALRKATPARSRARPHRRHLARAPARSRCGQPAAPAGLGRGAGRRRARRAAARGCAPAALDRRPAAPARGPAACRRLLRRAARPASAAPWLAARELQRSRSAPMVGPPQCGSAAPGSVDAARRRGALARRALAGRRGRAPRRASQLDARRRAAGGGAVAGALAARTSAGSGDLALGGAHRRAQRRALRCRRRARAQPAATWRRHQEGGAQALGLTDLRLALAAHDGTWHFTQALAGAQHRRARRRAEPAHRPARALAGARDAARRACWSCASPTSASGRRGCRRAGASAASCTPARRSAGASARPSRPRPHRRRRARGAQPARRRATCATASWLLSLRGDDARRRALRVHDGGDGTLRLTGGARFGAAPSAQLQLVAERFRLLGRSRPAHRRRAATPTWRSQAQALALDGALRDRRRADRRLARRRAERSTPTCRGAIARRRLPARRAGGRRRRQRRAAAAARRAGRRGAGRSTSATRCGCAAAASTRMLGGRLASPRRAGGWRSTAPCAPSKAPTPPTARSSTSSAACCVFTGERRPTRGWTSLAVRPEPRRARRRGRRAAPAQAPRVRLFSEPEMSELDKLSGWCSGRAPDGLARADTALLQRAALALLAGEGAGRRCALLQQPRARRVLGAPEPRTARCATPSSRWASSCRGAGTSATSAASTHHRHLAADLPRGAALHAARAVGRGQRARRDLDLALELSELHFKTRATRSLPLASPPARALR